MKTDIESLFKMKHFFKIVKSTDNHITYNLKPASQLLMKNIHVNWLQYVYVKTHKQMPVYLNESFKKLTSIPTVYGSIEQNLKNYDENTLLEQNLSNRIPLKASRLQFNLVIPQLDAMQSFIQWQRYRKYWWSSISTTPSLFAVNDIKYQDKSASVDIVARLAFGDLPVENIAINFEENNKSSCLSCSMLLENALNILLLDGLNSNINNEYLRLHRKIAPYKISFALDLKETDKKDTLKELATLLHHKLDSNQILTWLPDFTLPYASQVKENLRMGVPYTAILNEETQKNGIFRLMSSSTMLGEQVHVADFHQYAAVLFK